MAEFGDGVLQRWGFFIPAILRNMLPAILSILLPAMTVQVEDKIRVTPRRWPDFVVQGQHKQYLTVVNAVLREHGHAQRKYELVLI